MSLRLMAAMVVAAGVCITPRANAQPRLPGLETPLPDDFNLQDQQFPPPPGRDELLDRILRIQSILDADTRHARLWHGIWVATYGSIAAGQLIRSLTVKDENHQNQLRLNAFGSTVGFLRQVLVNYPARYAAEELRSLPLDTDTEVYAGYDKAVELLRASASAEERTHNLITHIAAAAVSASLGAIIWQVFDRPRAAISTVVGGVVINEVRTYSAPSEARRAYVDITGEPIDPFPRLKFSVPISF